MDDQNAVTEAKDAYLRRLQGYRNPPRPDLSLRELPAWFRQHVEKPHKQMGQIAEAWLEHVPESLRRHTRLVSLTRGVLNVRVTSATHHYELDRLLRAGLRQTLIERSRRTTLRRIKITVGPLDTP